VGIQVLNCSRIVRYQRGNGIGFVV